MDLKTYLEKTPITLRNFGLKSGISIGMICDLKNGKKTPSLATVKKIQEATNGKVKANDWIGK